MNLFNHFKWVWSDMPKVIENNNLVYIYLKNEL